MIAVMKPQVKNTWDCLKRGEDPLLEALEGAWHCLHLGVRLLAPGAAKECFSCVKPQHMQHMRLFVPAVVGNHESEEGRPVLEMKDNIFTPNKPGA